MDFGTVPDSEKVNKGGTRSAEVACFDALIAEIRDRFLTMGLDEQWRTVNTLRMVRDGNLDIVLKRKHQERKRFDYEGARQVREKSGLTQKKLCNMLGIASYASLSHYENGRRNPLSSKKKGAIAYIEWLKK